MFTGRHVKNDELAEYDKAQLALTACLHSDHFWATTGANGYSGFLQMGLICPIDHRLAPKGILGIQEARGLKILMRAGSLSGSTLACSQRGAFTKLCVGTPEALLSFCSSCSPSLSTLHIARRNAMRSDGRKGEKTCQRVLIYGQFISGSKASRTGRKNSSRCCPLGAFHSLAIEGVPGKQTRGRIARIDRTGSG